MSRHFRNLLLLLGGAVFGLVVSMASGVFAQKDRPAQELPRADARLLAEVLERVRQEYVEPVSDSVLIESAVRGMVNHLDAHSQFLDCDEYAQVRISTSGNYSGIGLEVYMENDEVRVIAAVDDTPAAAAGLMSGDVILAIDDETLNDRNYDQAVSRMRGPAGTPVKLTVKRVDVADPVDFIIIRKHVNVRSVRAHLVASDYAYLRISHFSDTTAADTRKAIRKLSRETDGGRLRGLVLDLRNNPGGVLESAVAVADGFLDSGVIVSASGRASDASFSHAASRGDLLDGARIVVLVNAGSASSSEIVAAALRDNGRAEIVGTRTFGKGSVQTVMPLSSCRAVKLTTSHYFTPSGRSIHGVGIEPDTEVKDDPLSDALAGVRSHQKSAGAALLQADLQLREAFRILQGERVMHSQVTL